MTGWSHLERLDDELKWMIFQYVGYKTGLRIRETSKNLLQVYDKLSKREFEYQLANKHIRGAFPWPKFRPAGWILLKILLPQMTYVTDKETRILVFDSLYHTLGDSERFFNLEFFDLKHECKVFFNHVLYYYYRVDLSMFMIVMEGLLRARLFKLDELTFPADMDWPKTFIEACKERRTVLARSILRYVIAKRLVNVRAYSVVYEALVQTACCGDSFAIKSTFKIANDLRISIAFNEIELIIHTAVQCNNLSVVQWLYSQFPEQKWDLKLFAAVEYGSVKVLRWLLETLQPESDLQKLGNNILHVAALRNKYGVIDAVLQYGKINLLSENISRWNALQILLSNSEPCRESVKAIIDAANEQGILPQLLTQMVPDMYFRVSTMSMLYRKGLDYLIPELNGEIIESINI